MSMHSLRSQIVVVSIVLLGSFTSAAHAQDAPSTNQDAASVSANVVPQGTVFLIQLTDRLDTHTVKAGDRFQARLAEPVASGSGLTVEAGRKVKGHVSAVEPGLHTRLLLSFDEVDTGHGWMPLFATVTGVPGEHGLNQVGEEGEIGRKGMTKEQIAEAVVVGAGESAAGAVHNGANKKAAATSAGEGAANSAFTAFESGHDLILEKGTALEIRLDRNLTIPGR